MAPHPSGPQDDADPPAGSKRDIVEAWARHRRRGAPLPPKEEPKRDILAEHFGDDWRTSFDYRPPSPGHDPAADDESARSEPEAPVDSSDPYAVLGVEHGASWEVIVEAHRSAARHNHPDQLYGRPDDERAAAEERMRDINVAYQELRIRRGK